MRFQIIFNKTLEVVFLSKKINSVKYSGYGTFNINRLLLAGSLVFFFFLPCLKASSLLSNYFVWFCIWSKRLLNLSSVEYIKSSYFVVQGNWYCMVFLPLGVFIYHVYICIDMHLLLSIFFHLSYAICN